MQVSLHPPTSVMGFSMRAIFGWLVYSRVEVCF